MTRISEVPVSFKSQGQLLQGILHNAEHATRALIIVTGGPQTRVGSHRMFVQLARFLAEQNITVLRFDYRGAGDSLGAIQSFDSTVDDIAAAVKYMYSINANFKLSLWGLCDAASAISLYINRSQESQAATIANAILVNPWVKQPSLEAQTYLKFYYWQRIKQADFWKKLFFGKLNPLISVQDISKFKKQARTNATANFVNEMLHGLSNFNGRCHLVLAEQDLVAQEFMQLKKQDKRWQNIKFVTDVIVEHANHTFSSPYWKKQLFELTLSCIRK